MTNKTRPIPAESPSEQPQGEVAPVAGIEAITLMQARDFFTEDERMAMWKEFNYSDSEIANITRAVLTKQVEQSKPSDNFWLIERGPNQGEVQHWWFSTSLANSALGAPRGDWTLDVQKATKFATEGRAREKAADCYVQHYAVTSHSFLGATNPAEVEQSKPGAWPKEVQPDGSVNEVDPLDMVAGGVAEPVAWQAREMLDEDWSDWRECRGEDLVRWQSRVARRPDLYELRALCLCAAPISQHKE